LNITVYVLASRFLEGAVKHLVYNCCVMRGDSENQLNELESELKKFNNPEFNNIKSFILKYLSFDIAEGLRNSWFNQRDVFLLNEIVNNRHKNVHATHDSADWYNKNLKDLNDFNKEYIGMLNILCYLDSISWNSTTNKFEV
jgi:hypothetical protein